MTAIPPTLTIGGQVVNLSAANLDSAPTALAPLTLHWGRAEPIEDNTPSTLSVAIAIPRDQAVPSWLAEDQPVLLTAQGPVIIPEQLCLQLEAQTTSARQIEAINATSGNNPSVFPGDGNRPYIRHYLGTKGIATAWNIAPGLPGASWEHLARSVVGAVTQFSVNLAENYWPYRIQLRPLLYTSSSATPTVGPIIATSGEGWKGTLLGTYTPTIANLWMGIRVEVISPPISFGLPPRSSSPWTWASESRQWGQFNTWTVINTPEVRIRARDGAMATLTIHSGEVDTLSRSWDRDLDRPVVKIVTRDLAGVLAARTIGDEPWPTERSNARVTRILAAAGITGYTVQGLDINGGEYLAPRDVDARAALEMLNLVATSNGCVLHVIGTMAAPIFRFVPWRGRTELTHITLSASQLPRDGVDLSAGSGLNRARVEVSYKQTVDGKQVERWTGSSPTGGYNSKVKIATDLLLGSALTLATNTRTLLAASTWTMAGLSLTEALPDSFAPALSAIGTVLDSTSRAGQPLDLTDLPVWMPSSSAALAVIGGRITLDQPGWTVDLNVINVQE